MSYNILCCCCFFYIKSFAIYRYSPYSKEFEKCRICKSSVHQKGSHYCQGLFFNCNPTFTYFAKGLTFLRVLHVCTLDKKKKQKKTGHDFLLPALNSCP